MEKTIEVKKVVGIRCENNAAVVLTNTAVVYRIKALDTRLTNARTPSRYARGSKKTVDIN